MNAAVMYGRDWITPNNWDWFSSSQVIDLYTDVKSQVVDIVGYIGVAFKIISRTDNNLIEQPVNIISVIISPYELGNHRTIKPFDVSIECLSSGDFVARFDSASIAIVSDSVENAINELKETIIILFDTYKSSELGPEPAKQLRILEKYIE